MSKRDELKRAVIEAIHGMPYEEAVERYLTRGTFLNGGGISWGVVLCGNYNGKVLYAHGNQTREISQKEALKVINIEITIGSVLCALQENKMFRSTFISAAWSRREVDIIIEHEKDKETEVHWRLINKDGSEATDDSQSDETVSALLNLLKP